MENIKFPIFFTTAFMLLVNIIPFLGLAYSIIATMLFFAPFIVAWMVVRTLKDGMPSNKTFDMHWYEDEVV